MFLLNYYGTTLDQLKLQNLNQFWYRSAVGRVSVTFLLDDYHYFTNWWINSKAVYKVGKHLEKVTYKEYSNINFLNIITCQINDGRLFGFKHKTCDASWIQYSGFYSLEIKMLHKAKPLSGRDCPALANFQDQYLFCVGGRNMQGDEIDGFT